MKQIAYTVSDGYDFLSFLNEIAKKDYYTQAASILVQVFTSRCEQPYIEYIIKIITKCLPKAMIAGLTTVAEISNGDKQKDSTVLSISFFEESEVIVEEYDCDDTNCQAAGAKLNDRIQQLENLAGIQLFAIPSKLDVNTFMSEVNADIEHVPIFGAGAGIKNYAQEGMYIFGKQVYDRGLVAIFYVGKNLHIQTEYCLGWMPIGKEMEITKTRGNLCIEEIDHKPAISIYQKYLHVDPNEMFVSNTCEFPLVMKRKNVLIARTPLEGRQTGEIIFTSDVRTGEKIRFSYGNTKALLEEAKKSSRKMKDFQTQAMFLFACINREKFLKNDEKQEIEYFKNVCGSVAGCFAYSEILANQDCGGVLNSALVVVGMREGELDENIEELHEEVLEARSPEENSIPLQERLVTFLEAITTELNESNKSLKKLATTDELTGLLNRHRTEQILNYEVNKDYSAGRLSVVMFDIDNFKGINDTYGHEAGDMVLSKLAGCVKQKMREQYLLGRWGGEEFMCILPDTTHEDAIQIAQLICDTVRKNDFDRVGNVTISVGITTAVENDNLQSIYERVDQLLYHAKETGKNRVCAELDEK